MNIEQLVIQGAGQEFKAKDFNDLTGPGVYVLMARSCPLYVGRGKNLLARVSGSQHQKRDMIKECERILLFPCVSDQAAEQLETELIGRFQPPGNTNKRYTALAAKLGVKYLSTKEKVRVRLAATSPQA